MKLDDSVQRAEPGLQAASGELVAIYSGPSVVDALFYEFAKECPALRPMKARATAQVRAKYPRLENYRLRDLRERLDTRESRPERLAKLKEFFDEFANCVAAGMATRPTKFELAKQMHAEWTDFVLSNSWLHYQDIGATPEDASDLHKVLFNLTNQSRGKALSTDQIAERLNPTRR